MTITADISTATSDAALSGLAEFTAATSTAVRANPTAGQVRPSVRTELVPGTATQVSVFTSSHEFTIDEPAGLGGTDQGANPIEHLLAALGACQVISYRFWAAKLGIALDTVDVRLAGDIDLRGFLGIDPSVRPGFESIDVEVVLGGPETQQRYEALSAAVEEHCPVLDNLSAGLPVRGRVSYV